MYTRNGHVPGWIWNVFLSRKCMLRIFLNIYIFDATDELFLFTQIILTITLGINTLFNIGNEYRLKSIKRSIESFVSGINTFIVDKYTPKNTSKVSRRRKLVVS